MMAVIVVVGGLCLLLGYGLGYRYLKGLWLVYIVSITSILIIEPIVIYLLTGESPNLGARIGFACGVMGFVSALVIR